jgi:hypothetical protein
MFIDMSMFVITSVVLLTVASHMGKETGQGMHIRQTRAEKAGNSLLYLCGCVYTQLHPTR